MFMKVDVRYLLTKSECAMVLIPQQDPAVQEATGKTKPVDVMAALREMKNNS